MPKISRAVSADALSKQTKWTRLPATDVQQEAEYCRLADLFTVQRGIATGHNKFFILTKGQIEARGLPFEMFRPILPSPRYITVEEIEADKDGVPLLSPPLFLLDCALPEAELKEQYPKLWAYLEEGKPLVAGRYLCLHRKIWYSQEQRPPAPIVCTYIARSDTKNGRSFRFILNHSKATAANVYLLLFPKPKLAGALRKDRSLLRNVWQMLNGLGPEALLRESRVYGGGLHKLEPKELGNVDVTPILEIVPGPLKKTRFVQSELFDQRTGT